MFPRRRALARQTPKVCKCPREWWSWIGMGSAGRSEGDIIHPHAASQFVIESLTRGPKNRYAHEMRVGRSRKIRNLSLPGVVARKIIQDNLPRCCSYNINQETNAAFGSDARSPDMPLEAVMRVRFHRNV